jgi:ComF family protein
MGFWSAVLTSVLDALAPPACLACDAACTESHPFCVVCGAPTRPSERLFVEGSRVAVVGPYCPPLSTAIVRFKYQGRAELSRPLSTLLVPAVTALALPEDVAMVPVPMHPRRLAQRGYNQAALLARELSRAVGCQYRPRLLRRTRQAERQVGKTRVERLDNMCGAFELSSRERAPARAVLIDDVITTGATVRACAQALEAGGVEMTAIVALAHAEPG